MNVSRVFVCLFFFLVVVLPHQFYFSIRKVSVNIGNFIANVVYILLLYAVCLPCSKSFSVGGRNTSSCKQIEFHLDDAYTFSYFLLYFSSFVVDLSLDCSFLDFNSSLPLSLSLCYSVPRCFALSPFLGTRGIFFTVIAHIVQERTYLHTPKMRFCVNIYQIYSIFNLSEQE